MQTCGKQYHLVQSTENSNTSFTVYPHRCKSWDCAQCRRRKSKKVTSAIDSRFTTDSLYFLTLTFDHSRSLRETWQESGKAWNKLITHARKKNAPFSYIRIVEPHKNIPYPHYHVLVSIDIFTKDFFLYSKTLGFGQQQQQTRVTGARAKQYVTKYLGKAWPDNGSYQIRKETKTRVLSTSRDFGALFMTHGTGIVLGRFLSAEESIAQLQGATVQAAYNGAFLDSYDITETRVNLTYTGMEGIIEGKHVISSRIVCCSPWTSITLYTRNAVKQETLFDNRKDTK